MRDEHPDSLLKSALEKIVYFEARSEQLHSDLAGAQGKIARLKEELAAAAQREIELRREVAELQVKANRSRNERDELDKLNEALRSERAALLGKLIEAARIHDSDKKREDGDSPFDLASFIAELRSEAIAQKATPAARPPAARPATAFVGSPPMPTWPSELPARARPPPSEPAIKTSATEAPLPPPPPLPARQVSTASSVAQHAARLKSEGRLAVSHEQVLELSAVGPFPGRTEETLFGFSIRELCAPEPSARRRAAERLKALGNTAAAPALATALHAETDPETQVVFLGVFSALAQSEGVAIIVPHLQSDVPEVRIAALKALIALDPAHAGPHVAAAIKDQDRAVRRRASLLALGLSGSAALKLGEQAIVDPDPEGRSLAALVLGASSGERARVLLLDALADRDPKVREAAAQSLSRILGQDVSPVVALADAERRREVRRLASLPSNPVRSAGRSKALVKGYFNVATQPPPNHSPSETAPAIAQGKPLPPQNLSLANSTEALCSAVMAEIRSALRGRSLAELAASTNCTQDIAQQTCELLVARGQVVRRGLKYFAA